MEETILNMTEEELLTGSLETKIDRLLVLYRSNASQIRENTARISAVYEKVDQHVKATAVKFQDMTKKYEELQKKFNNVKLEYENKQVLNEYHNKKYNLWLNNMPEVVTGSAWETNVESIDGVRKFFKDVLKVEGANNMSLANAHRVGLRKTVTDETTGQRLITRPIIVRFNEMPDKEKVVKALPKLSLYNNGMCKVHRVYVTEHFPQRMENQRKALLDDYLNARRENKKTRWSADNEGNYILYVDKATVAK